MARTADPLRPGLAPGAPTQPPKRFSWTTVGVGLGLGLYAYYLWLWLILGKPVGAAILLGPILVALTTPLFLRANRRNPGFDLAGLLLLGLVLRFAFAYYRFTHAIDAYGYRSEGLRLAGFYRNLDFAAPTLGKVPGTGGLNAIAGGVHVLVADDFFGSFLLMTWLGFLGCWFLYRAFEISVGDGDHYRYARLVLLWPSMCFWPSSLGKDAWMVFTIGITAYGAARILQRMFGGYTLMGLGLFGASFVRPHLALLMLVAFVMALIVGRRHSLRETVTPSLVAKLMGLALVLVIGSVLVTRTQRILDIEDFNATSIESASTYFSEKSAVGESTFAAPNPRSPTGFLEATVTVLFRPFPTEARGSEQILTAAEGLFLAILTAASWRRLLTIPRRLRAQPYLMLSLAYVLLWILAFGVIANFGILARQRTQMLPFYFALVSVAAVVAKPERAPAVAEPTSRR